MSSMEKGYEGVITIEPGKRSGQPVIRGMRITVKDILEMLAAGMSEKEIVQDFPELTKRDIQAAFSYASEKGLNTATDALRNYTAVFKKSGKWIVAWIEEIPGVMTQGKTIKEARKNLRDALSLMLECIREETEREERGIKREDIRVALPSLAA